MRLFQTKPEATAPPLEQPIVVGRPGWSIFKTVTARKYFDSERRWVQVTARTAPELRAGVNEVEDAARVNGEASSPARQLAAEKVRFEGLGWQFFGDGRAKKFVGSTWIERSLPTNEAQVASLAEWEQQGG